MSQTTELLLKIRQQGGEQLTRLQSSLKNLGQQSNATNVNFKELANELKNIQQTSVQSINNLRGYATAWREIANSVKIGSAEFKQASAEAAKLEAQLRKTQGGRGRLAAGAQIAGTAAGAAVFGGIEGGAGALIGGLVGGVPGAIVGGGIGAQVGMTRQMLGGTATYAAEISRQRQALQLVTKDAGEYQRALTFIDRTSRQLAIPQEILTRQFTQLTASVKGAGGNVRDAEKAFIGIASGIRGTGGSLEQLDSALTATSQVFSKGKVSAEELRQQIGERLPGAFSLFAKSIGMTPQELDKALEKGQVSLQDFQKFAEELFREYGENAKIIADGPDAAGDRLRTSLSRLSESVGTLLKPIGASFQNEMAKVILAIDGAIKKLNEFFGLGKGRQGEINRLQQVLDVTDKRLRDFENLFASRGGKMGLEEGAYKTLQQRKASTFAQLSGLLAAETAAASSTGPEPPSKLPGITPDAGKDESAKRLRKLQTDFERSVAVLGRQFNIETRKQLLNEILGIENQISEALKKGNIEEMDRLRTLQQRRTLEITRDVLINEEERIEQKINEGKQKGVDLTQIQNRLAEIRNEREQTLLALKKLENDEAKKAQERLKEEAEARFDISLEIAKAQLGSKDLSEEDEKRVRINQFLGQIIEKYAAKLTSPELLDAIKKIREAMEGVAKATGTFGEKIAKSFGEAIKSTGDLAANLGNSLGNVFVGLGDQLADFVTTGKLQFADFARSVLNDLTKIFIRAAMFNLLKAVVPSGSALGKVLGFADGGIMTAMGPMKLKQYAAGGIAYGPQLAMFGEGSRPEAYVPLPDGRSIPVTMKGGGSGDVVVNVDASGTSVQGNQPNAAALGRAIGSAVQAELIKQKRPGGLLA